MTDNDLIRRGDAVVAAQACPDSHWGPQIAAAIAEVQTNRTTTPTEYERKVAQMKEDFPNGI